MRKLDLQLFGEGQEPATPKRRREARQKGQIARSAEIGTIAVLLSGMIALQWSAPLFWNRLLAVSASFLSGDIIPDWTDTGIQTLAWQMSLQMAWLLMPLMGVVILVGITSQLAQIGFYLGGAGLVPQFSKINPAGGLKRIFSRRTAVEWLKSMFKVGILGFVGYRFLTGALAFAEGTVTSPLTDQLSHLLVTMRAFAWQALVILAALAVADYIYQRWDLEKSLSMTKQEVKQEMKQTEGDPLLRGRRREMQRQMLRQMMLHEVAKADVVITNPTHYAVALRYTETMDAPRVVAKGRNVLAQKIKEIARKHNVIVMEDRKLAQALYKTVEIGQSIPEELFYAVAEILAFVWKIKGKVG